MPKFSNKNKKDGKYICKYCGVILTSQNTYRNQLKRKHYHCKECDKKTAREYAQKYYISNQFGAIKVKEKLPSFPKDGKCMLCNNPPRRKTGLNFHHWFIIKKIAYGIWLCCVCHMFAERVDNQYIDKYLKLKKKILGDKKGDINEK